MSDHEHNDATPEEITDETTRRYESEELPLTGEEVTLPGEASATEDIIGGAIVIETSQIEPVHMGVTPTSLDDVLASRAQDDPHEHDEHNDEAADEDSDHVEQAEPAEEESSHEELTEEEPAEEEHIDVPAVQSEPAEDENPGHDEADFETEEESAQEPEAEESSEAVHEDLPQASDDEQEQASETELTDEADEDIHTTTTIPAASDAPAEETEEEDASAPVGEVPDALSRRNGDQVESSQTVEDDELESTSVRRRAFVSPQEEIPAVAAAWKPREDSTERSVPQETPESLDDVLFEGATVVPEMPSRTGAHWFSFLLGILALPITWYLVADAGARMTLPAGNPAATGAINWLAISELVIACVAIIALFEAFKRSSVGAWIGGICFLIAGIPWVFAPAFTAAHTVSVLHFLQNAGSFGSNLAHHLQVAGYSGRFLILGLMLMGIASLSHSVRRRGRSEEATRQQVERVNPTGAHYTARERRRAEKAAGLR